MAVPREEPFPCKNNRFDWRTPVTRTIDRKRHSGRMANPLWPDAATKNPGALAGATGAGVGSSVGTNRAGAYTIRGALS